MPKSGTERQQKYAAKFDAEVIRSRFTATKDIAVTKQTSHQEALAKLASFVNSVMADNGISPLLAMIYQGFANSIYSLSLKFTGDVLKNEAWAQCNKYYTRLGQITVGSSSVPLFNVNVANAILGYFNIPEWTPPT